MSESRTIRKHIDNARNNLDQAALLIKRSSPPEDSDAEVFLDALVSTSREVEILQRSFDFVLGNKTAQSFLREVLNGR